MSSAAEPSNAKRTYNDRRATEREEENTQRIQLYSFYFCYWLLAHSESEENDRVRLDPIGKYIVSPRFIFSVYSSLSHSRFSPVQPKTIHKQLSASLVSVWYCFFLKNTRKKKRYVHLYTTLHSTQNYLLNLLLLASFLPMVCVFKIVV